MANSPDRRSVPLYLLVLACLLSSSASATCVDMPSDLVLWMPFNEGAGSTQMQDRASSYVATISGQGANPGFGGIVNLCAQFAGLNGSFVLPNHPSIEFGDADFTIMAWVMWFDGGGGGPIASTFPGYLLQLDANGFPGLGMCDQSLCYSFASNVAIAANTWTHLAVSFASSGGVSTARFYLNGVLASTDTKPVEVGVLSAGEALYVGGGGPAYPGFLDGRVDELLMFRRSLNAGEIAAINAPGDYGDGYCVVDCNANGIVDSADIAAGTSRDCNANGIADDCEPDCNGNGIPDDCDIDPTDPDADGTVIPDCNGNGIPDDC